MASEFDGDSGLKEDWDGTITAAEFEQSQRGNWQLRIHVAADDGDDQELVYSVGGKDKGWQSYDGGETITGSSEKQRFHVKSGMQKFIDAVMKTEAKDVLISRSANLYNRRGPFHAALWQGLRFHWDVVKEEGSKQMPDGTWQDTMVDVVRPVRFLGEGAGGKTPKPASTPAANTPTPTPAANGNSGGEVGDVDEADLKTLTRLAMTYDAHGEFVDAVMEETFSNGEKGLRNKPIMKLVTKRDWYEGIRS